MPEPSRDDCHAVLWNLQRRLSDSPPRGLTEDEAKIYEYCFRRLGGVSKNLKLTAADDKTGEVVHLDLSNPDLEERFWQVFEDAKAKGESPCGAQSGIVNPRDRKAVDASQDKQA